MEDKKPSLRQRGMKPCKNHHKSSYILDFTSVFADEKSLRMAFLALNRLEPTPEVHRMLREEVLKLARHERVVAEHIPRLHFASTTSPSDVANKTCILESSTRWPSAASFSAKRSHCQAFSWRQRPPTG